MRIEAVFGFVIPYRGLACRNRHNRRIFSEETVDVIGTADAIPLRNGVSDAVLSSQVIEHLPNPDLAFAETARILKNGELLFISFPFIYPLHVAPHDYYRYSEHGFEALCRRHGFEIVEEHRLGGFWCLSSVICELYFGSFDRSVLKGVPVLALLSLPLHWLFWLLHNAESLLYRLAGNDVRDQRRGWTVNYVFVARRTANSPT